MSEFSKQIASVDEQGSFTEELREQADEFCQGLDELREELGHIRSELIALEPVVKTFEESGELAFTTEQLSSLITVVNDAAIIRPLLAELAEDFGLDVNISLMDKLTEVLILKRNSEGGQTATERFQETKFKIENVQTAVISFSESFQSRFDLRKEIEGL